MTRSDLVQLLAKRCKMAVARAEAILDAIFDDFTGALKRGERVEIRGLGSLHVRSKGYLGRNPKTGTPIEVRPKRLPYFKPSVTFSSSLNDTAKKGGSSRVVPDRPSLPTNVAGNGRSA
jgi:integration host factor subunit beta